MARAASLCGGPCETKTALAFDGTRPDRLWITLPKGSSDAERAKVATDLVRALDRVATENHLTRAPAPGAALDYLSGGKHVVTVNLLQAAPREDAGAGPVPRLAIILDDFGNDLGAFQAVLALRCPVTFSVLPNHPHSVEIAREAKQKGYQVLLHLPMQSVANETPEPRELRPGMSGEEVEAMLRQMLEAVPGVVGVNNHQGSEATTDIALMSELMPRLRDRGLFYIDSRTSAATVAYDVARGDAVRSGFRNVPFLDDVAEVGAVRKQIELAIQGAKTKGQAIAIGHPHAATLRALREALPRAKERGVRLVFVSELVR